jgi:hypothetical protein
MDSLATAKQQYVDRREDVERIRARIEQRQQQLVRLDAKLSRAYAASYWTNIIVRPLAEALRVRLGAAEAEVLGPFGIGARTSIWLFMEARTDEQKGGGRDWKQPDYSLTVLPADLPDLRYETGRVIKRYESHTLGDLNGMNNETADLPDDLDEIANIVLHAHDYDEEGDVDA